KAKLMLSNSDPKNENKENDFFDRLYEDYHIYRVDARRVINSNPEKRGLIKELIIVNY
ncbi:MAG: DNA adenine methylase, partial [Candidatus Eremiobacterota bacterium]